MLGEFDTTTVGTLVSAIAAMGTAIGYLHRRLLSEMSSMKDDLIAERKNCENEILEIRKAFEVERNECRRDRERLWRVLAKIEGTDVENYRQNID
jgi:hypothetical protein